MEKFIGMPSDNAWEIAGNYDPTKFFEALRLFAGQGRLTLYIEGTSPAIKQELLLFEAAAASPVRPGTTWPEGTKMHLRVTPELIDKLVSISNENAVPDYADHIVLYGDDVILEAYDFTLGPCHISGTVDENRAREFARNLGNTLSRTTI